MQDGNSRANLESQVAIVTGAGRGIGRAMAKAIASAGGKVCVTARSAQQVAEVVGEINASAAPLRDVCNINRRLAPVAVRRSGRVVGLKGDGVLLEFPRAVDALAAAIEFQQTMVEANRSKPEDKAILFSDWPSPRMRQDSSD